MADAKRLGEVLDADKPSEALKKILEDPVWQCDLAELVALKGLESDPQYAPHDPYDHTVMALDLAALLLKDYHVPAARRLHVLLATLLHDTGKADFPRQWDKWEAGEHTAKSVAHAREFLRRFGAEEMTLPVTELIWLYRRFLKLPIDAPEADFRAVLDCIDQPLDLLIMTAANRVATEKELGEYEGTLSELPPREQMLYHRFRQAA